MGTTHTLHHGKRGRLAATITTVRCGRTKTRRPASNGRKKESAEQRKFRWIKAPLNRHLPPTKVFQTMSRVCPSHLKARNGAGAINGIGLTFNYFRSLSKKDKNTRGPPRIESNRPPYCSALRYDRLDGKKERKNGTVGR